MCFIDPEDLPSVSGQIKKSAPVLFNTARTYLQIIYATIFLIQ